jgi:hypothetical protein
MSIKLTISRRESLPMLGLRKRLNHKVHQEHKESKPCNASSLCPPALSDVEGLCPSWFTWIRSAVSSRTRSSPAPLGVLCELLFEMRTGCNESSATASRHGRFLLLMAIFGQKKCAPPVRTSHKWRTSICDPLFSQTRPVSRNMHNTCEKNTCDL